MSKLLVRRRSTTWIPVLVFLFLGSYTAFGQLAAATTTVNFGTVQVGSMNSVPIPISNGSKSNLTISQATVSGTGFSLAGPNLPMTLAPQQSANLYVTFYPQAPGSASGSLMVTTSNLVGRWQKQHGSATSFSLSGTGTAGSYLTPSTASVSFGSVPVGSTRVQSLTVNNSGGSSVTVSQAAVNGGAFSISGFNAPVTLAAGQNLTLSVAFTPSSSGSASGTLAISSTASDSSLPISLSGAGASAGYLTPSASNINFGSIPTGTTQQQSVTVNNSGGSSVTISQAAVSGTGFTMSALSAPVTLAAGQSLTLTVAFTPTSSGTSSGTLAISSNASDSTLPISLAGAGTTAAGQLTASPVSLSFGNVSVGSSSVQSGALSASGSSVTISSASSNNSQFAIGGISLPITIPAGQSVPFNVTFSPLVTGAVSGSVSFVSNASTSAVAEAVTGSGQAVQHSVSLSWSPSSSTVTGYNIYRGTISGGPYAKINASVDAVTTYADSTVLSGQTYYYVTTAVDSSGTESAHSNQVVAQIP